MNKPLYEIFQDLTPSDYSYYKDNYPYLNLVQFSDDDNVKFIHDYFTRGGKGCVYDSIISAYCGDHKMRASHSVSMYLTGLCLHIECNALKCIIDNQLEIVNIDDFRYLWFLFSLYHDSTLHVEDVDSNSEQLISRQLEFMRKYFKHPYTLSNILLYYKFRISNGRNDHGIYAGCLFYKRMSRNINNAVAQKRRICSRHNEYFDKNDFYYKNLHWSAEHKKWHAFIASLIIKHNIWFRNIEIDLRTDIEEYVAHNIAAFIIDNNLRMSFDSNPLLFLFCIIDTIEPVKLLHKCCDKNIDILKGIGISIKDIGDKLQLSITKSDNFEQCKFDLVAQRAKTLQDWMKVEVKKICDDLVIIEWSVSELVTI